MVFKLIVELSKSKINYFFQKTLRLFLIIFSFDVIAFSTLNIDFKESTVSSFSILKDSFGNGRLTGNELGKIPKANIDLIISPNGEVIPRKQGLIETDNKFWNILFEPGKWYLKDKRISIVLPFALIEKGQNCTHQGLLIIENDNAGYQIASETCIYFQFNSQGQVDITIKSIDLPNSDEILAKHTNYVANRMPTKSIVDLALVNEQLKENIFSQDNFINPGDMTSFGVILDNQHYTGPCLTRGARFPDCDYTPLPAYSLTKSLVGGVALMRLERLYPGAKDIAVSDLIPECSHWEGITLYHLLNNTTGRYGKVRSHYDEENHIGAFFNLSTSRERLKHVCNRYKQKSKPGSKWVYHTTEFWLLGQAIQRFWEAKAGANREFYEDLIIPIWRELKLSPLIEKPHRLENIPLTGWGLMLRKDDIAKIGSDITSEKSILRKYLDEEMLNNAMQKNSSNRGSVAGAESLRYKNGFWAWNASDTLDCNKESWIPFMSGYGGIQVVLLPINVVYYYFSDSGVFRFAEVVKNLNQHQSIC